MTNTPWRLPLLRDPLAGPATLASPTGIWIDHTGRGAVEITECAGRLCGRVVWLKDTGHKSVCGTQVIGNAKPVGKDTWDGGWIYDPDQNAKYSVELKTIGADKLRVMGYMGSKLFSETFIWKRAAMELERCDTTPANLDAETCRRGRDGAETAGCPTRRPGRRHRPPIRPHRRARRQGQDRWPARRKKGLQATGLQEIRCADRRDDFGALRGVGRGGRGIAPSHPLLDADRRTPQGSRSQNQGAAPIRRRPGFSFSPPRRAFIIGCRDADGPGPPPLGAHGGRRLPGKG